jgi:hypothetical protein
MPAAGVVVRRSGPYHTVFKILRSYRNVKGVPTSDRIVIGKMDPETLMLIPNDNYWKFCADAVAEMDEAPRRGSVRSVGWAYLFSRISDDLGLTGILGDCLGEDRARLVLAAARRMAAGGDVSGRVPGCRGRFSLPEAPPTPEGASELFGSITPDERMEFFRTWLARHPSESFLAYDSASFSSYPKGFMKSLFGPGKDGGRLPQVNFGCYLSRESGLPMFYVVYPGPIVDKSRLPCMLACNHDLGVKKVAFVMDGGFRSPSNVKFMADEGHEFIMEVEIEDKIVRETVDRLRGGMRSFRNLVAKGVYAKSKRLSCYGAAGALHVYHDPDLEAGARQDLERLVESEEEILAQLSRITSKDAGRYRRFFDIKVAKDGSFAYSRDFDKLDSLSKYFGCLCVLTNTNLDSSEILAVYRRKFMIEKAFYDLKNNRDIKRLGTGDDDAAEGKMFCAFIALIAASRIGAKLGERMRKMSWSQDDVIAGMDGIKVIVGASGATLADPVTGTQRLIMEPFGLDADDLEAYVKDGMNPS